ncbi:hypothetical protein A0U93_12945 [Neoasaia chiangmaiensis]|uniref:Dihydropteroate synthase n=1 Tax=Neoasaia chiangmaiensis TaxID=320497 RepID=A0A1U9KUK3_9PROT|nr:hypothetical protein A0U93_12945 [Neoasaia chiangmaiensis]
MSTTWVRRRDALRERLHAAHASGRPLVMGILNATPDSFSDGGQFDTTERALEHAADMATAGADIIDIGGESTRPGAVVLDADAERGRVVPVIEAIARATPIATSVDTYKASTARAAVAAGAVMINDVGGLRRDAAMASVMGETGALAVLMHHRDEITAELDILDDLRHFFDEALQCAERADVPRTHIVLDPGIGFGKTQAQNLACIAHLDVLRAAYDLPILLGLSRKSFLRRALDRAVDDRLGGTIGANLVGVVRGAAILRVHDVAAHVDAVRIQQILAEA